MERLLSGILGVDVFQAGMIDWPALEKITSQHFVRR